MLLPAISMAFPSDDGTRCWLGACVDFESHHGCRPRADLLREYEGGYLASDLMSNSSSLLGDGFLALDSRHGMPLDHDKDDQLSHTESQNGSQMVTCVAWVLEVNRQVLHPGNSLAVKYLKRLRAERREN